jgi:hypothetical protein
MLDEMTARPRWPRAAAGAAAATLGVLLCLTALVRSAAALNLQPAVALDGTGGVRNVTFVEGGAPVRLATSALQLTEAGGPCVSAVVRSGSHLRKLSAVSRATQLERRPNAPCVFTCALRARAGRCASRTRLTRRWRRWDCRRSAPTAWRCRTTLTRAR